MHAAVGSLLRRGLEMGHAHMQKNPHQKYQLPTWAAVLFGSTIAFFVAISFMVSYTFGRLIPTLVMVESPEEIIFEPLTSEDPDAPINKPNTEPEVFVGKTKPITASFRTTIRHLRSKGGRRANFRGFAIFIVNIIAVQWVAGLLSKFIPFLLAPIITSVLCAQLSLAWTHIVISDPNPKPWYRRIPSYKTWKKIAGPTAVLAIAEQAAVVLPAYLAATYDFMGNPDDFANTTPTERKIMALKALSILILSIVLSVLVIIPANVTLTRVQASLLPDEVESVVPFDRSFGGKVIPEIVGGSGVIGMLDAWKTFDWSARIRLLKTYAKVMAMQFAISILFFVVLGAEIACVVGKDWKKMFPENGKGGNPAVFH